MRGESVMRLPPGCTCVECGAPVEAKVLVPGAVRRLGPAVFTDYDRLTTNLPCGHDAQAEWNLDETAGMP